MDSKELEQFKNQLIEKRREILSHVLVELRLALHEAELRELLHQPQHVMQTAPRFLARLAQGP